MRNKSVILFFLVITLGFLFGCQKKDSKTQPNHEEPIKIGATLPLSGTYAYIGQQGNQAIRLAVDQINQEGGINGRLIKPYVEDNQGDIKKAVDAVNKFIDVDNVQIILSEFTHITKAIKDIVYSNHKILLYASTMGDMAAENKYGFRDFFDAGEHGAFLAGIVNQVGHKKIGFISEISTQCQEYKDFFKQEASIYGMQVLYDEQFPVEEKDLRTHILKLQPEHIDAIITCTWRHNDIFMKLLKEFDLIIKPTYQIVAPHLPSMDSQELRKLYAENKTVSTWYGFTKESNNPKYVAFKQSFQDKYNQEPSPEGAYFYDDILVLYNALKICGDRGQMNNNDCVAEELLKTDYHGAGGHLTFNKNGVSSRDVFAITVKNGEWVEID